MYIKARFKRILQLVAVIIVFFSWNLADKAICYPEKNLHSNSLSGQKIPLTNKGKMFPGPWGDLEAIPVNIQPPAGLFKNYRDIIDLINSSKQWIFKNASLQEIRSLFLEAGLDHKTCVELLNHTKPLASEAGFITTPSEIVFYGFSPELRAKLYPLIGKYSENTTYCYPFHYNSTNPEEWFFNSSLTKEQIKKLSSLVYISQNVCCISDLHLIAPLIKTTPEWIKLLRTIYRSPALDVYLKIEKGEDTGKLIDYWKNLNRFQFITMKFQSIQNKASDVRINIGDLLPAIPRIRLNTFASNEESDQYSMDCHWATFNFFNDQYDDRPILLNKICRPLFPEEEQPKFGDIYLMTDINNNVVHSCVYIASNIVFSKNGLNSATSNTPFMLSYFDKVLALYSSFYGQLRVSMFSRTIANTQVIP